MIRRRTFAAKGAFALAALGLAGCKRQRDPEAPEVWDDAPVPERAEALAKLAPPWPVPARAELGNGLLTFWLHEPAAGAVHVRLMLATRAASQRSTAASAVVAEAFRRELARRLGRLGVGVEVTEPPGRIEIGLHGRETQLRVMVRALGRILARKEPAAALLAGRQRLLKRLREPSSLELATAGATATLLGVPTATQWVDRAALPSVSTEALEDGWAAISDPANAVLVVHAPIPAAQSGMTMSALTTGWAGSAKKEGRGVLARLRPTFDEVQTKGRLLTGDSQPFLLVDRSGAGSPTLVIARALPLQTPRDRALARLSHRIAQEELDARFALVGDHGLFTMSTTVSGSNAERRIQDAVEDLEAFAKTRQPRQRLFAAAQLWLGARVVQSSLDGEDWTALFSESIDLSDRDDEIPRALARDATLMLSVEPEELTKWTSRWLNPRGGDEGWAWTIAGADDALRRTLSRTAPAQPLKL